MADGIDLDVSELNTVAIALGVESTQALFRAGQVVRASAQRVVATAQQLVPVDTGTTKGSIHATVVDQRGGIALEAEIGPTTEYAPYLEYGTVNMAPHAFMGPALDIVSPDFVAAAAQIVDSLR